MTQPPSFFSRIALAFRTFFSLLGDPDFALQVQRLRAATPTAAEPQAPSSLRQAAPQAALQLLGLLQRDAHFIDFVEEDVTPYSDAEIGAATRLVHEGCRRVLREHFTIVPVRDEAEGSPITLPPGFDAAAIRVTGNVVGKPPFNGSLSHRGWRVTETRLPKLADSHDPAIVAPAEVEL